MGEDGRSDLPAMWCLECGYDLRGLPEARCPECGQPFDLADATTFVSRLRSGTRYLAAAIVGGLAMASPLVVAWLNDLYDLGERFDAILEVLWPLGPVLLIGGFMVEWAVLVGSYKGLFGEPFRYAHRTMLAVAFAISGVLAIGSTAYVMVESACRLLR